MASKKEKKDEPTPKSDHRASLPEAAHTDITLPVDGEAPVAISEADRFIRNMNEAAAIEPPAVEELIERFTKRTSFDTPFPIKGDLLDRAYAWIPKHKVSEFSSENHTASGIYAFVNKANHPQVEKALFDKGTGGIVKGDLVLMWTRKSIVDYRDKVVTQDFNAVARKSETMNETTSSKSTIEASTDAAKLRSSEGLPELLPVHEMGVEPE